MLEAIWAYALGLSLRRLVNAGVAGPGEGEHAIPADRDPDQWVSRAPGKSRSSSQRPSGAFAHQAGALNPMNITHPLRDHARTWLLIAGLTALLVGIGALIGGSLACTKGGAGRGCGR